MKAVIIKEAGKAEVAEVKEQAMRRDYIKVKTVAVALNPTDYQNTDAGEPVGGILGCDVSGIVEEVGLDCKTDVKKGDKVHGVCHSANQQNTEDGAFAEFAMVKDGHLAKIPEGLSFEEAASLGVGVATVGQSLYLGLKLPYPTEPAKSSFPILIYGGSTATGTLAIQYAKLSGLKVITTASPKNFELLKSYGADAVFDYNDPECGEKIRAYTNNSLRYVFDCIAQESSFKIDAAALSSKSDEELHCLALEDADEFPRKDVNARWTLAYTTFGEYFTKYGVEWPANREDYDFGVKFWKIHASLLAEGKVRSHPVTVREGGLEGIPQGLDDLRQGRVRATKLVYRVR